jgi:hypothetical protein
MKQHFYRIGREGFAEDAGVTAQRHHVHNFASAGTTWGGRGKNVDTRIKSAHDDFCWWDP